MRAGCVFRELEGGGSATNATRGLCGLQGAGTAPIPAALTTTTASPDCSLAGPRPPACVDAQVNLLMSLGCNAACVASFFTDGARCAAAAGGGCEAVALPACDGSDVAAFQAAAETGSRPETVAIGGAPETGLSPESGAAAAVANAGADVGASAGANAGMVATSGAAERSTVAAGAPPWRPHAKTALDHGDPDPRSDPSFVIKALTRSVICDQSVDAIRDS